MLNRLGFLSGSLLKIYDDLVDDYHIDNILTRSLGFITMLLTLIFLSFDTISLINILAVVLVHLLVCQTESYQDAINTDMYKLALIPLCIIAFYNLQTVTAVLKKYKVILSIWFLITLLEMQYQFSNDKSDKLILRTITVICIILFLKYSYYVFGKHIKIFYPYVYFLLGYFLTSIISLYFQKIYCVV